MAGPDASAQLPMCPACGRCRLRLVQCGWLTAVTLCSGSDCLYPLIGGGCQPDRHLHSRPYTEAPRACSDALATKSESLTTKSEALTTKSEEIPVESMATGIKAPPSIDSLSVQLGDTDALATEFESLETDDLPMPSLSDSITAVIDQLLTADEPIAMPDETFVASTEASATSKEALATPNETIATPNETIATPNEALATPNEALATPNEALATPNEALATPNEALATPNEALGTLNETLATPNETLATSEEALGVKAAFDSVNCLAAWLNEQSTASSPSPSLSAFAAAAASASSACDRVRPEEAFVHWLRNWRLADAASAVALIALFSDSVTNCLGEGEGDGECRQLLLVLSRYRRLLDTVRSSFGVSVAAGERGGALQRRRAFRNLSLDPSVSLCIDRELRQLAADVAATFGPVDNRDASAAGVYNKRDGLLLAIRRLLKSNGSLSNAFGTAFTLKQVCTECFGQESVRRKTTVLRLTDVANDFNFYSPLKRVFLRNCQQCGAKDQRVLLSWDCSRSRRPPVSDALVVECPDGLACLREFKELEINGVVLEPTIVIERRLETGEREEAGLMESFAVWTRCRNSHRWMCMQAGEQFSCYELPAPLCGASAAVCAVWERRRRGPGQPPDAGRSAAASLRPRIRRRRSDVSSVASSSASSSFASLAAVSSSASAASSSSSSSSCLPSTFDFEDEFLAELLSPSTSAEQFSTVRQPQPPESRLRSRWRRALKRRLRSGEDGRDDVVLRFLRRQDSLNGYSAGGTIVKASLVDKSSTQASSIAA